MEKTATQAVGEIKTPINDFALQAPAVSSVLCGAAAPNEIGAAVEFATRPTA